MPRYGDFIPAYGVLAATYHRIIATSPLRCVTAFFLSPNRVTSSSGQVVIAVTCHHRIVFSCFVDTVASWHGVIVALLRQSNATSVESGIAPPRHFVITTSWLRVTGCCYHYIIPGLPGTTTSYRPFIVFGGIVPFCLNIRCG